MSHHIVEVKGLRHVYPDGTKALSDVSFRIHHGESVALVHGYSFMKTTTECRSRSALRTLRFADAR